jgi:hypothetical protein
MSTPQLITNPFEMEITKRRLIDSARSPLYVGTLWTLRMQYRPSAAAYALTGATIVMTITDGTNTITRKTGVTTAGAPAAQIVLDADQSTETGYTGKGWFQIRGDAVAADIASFALLADRVVDFEIALKLPDVVTQTVIAAGKIQLPTPKNLFPIT